MVTLDMFGFDALWSPYFFTFILLFIVAYFLLLVKFRSQFKSSQPLTMKQGLLFVISMMLLYTIKGSPIDLMAHLMFYVHMIQMAVLLLVIPPIFILGLPSWFWRYLIGIKGFHAFFHLFTKPIVALLIFNGLFSLYHIPMIFDFIMQNRWLHSGCSVLLFMTAIFMWWPLINDVPEMQQLTGLKKVAYIFADGMLLTPACALIIFANAPMYATYSDPGAWGSMMRLCVGNDAFSNLNINGPEPFSSMSLLLDQQLGGVLMKLIQEIVYGIVLGQVFFEWYRKDQAESEEENNSSLSPAPIE